jgi:SAM-dependent methyltransferase
MNLFRPAFHPESFDLVICNGVLHHTSDPLLGFESILGLVKQGGYVIIGLYNRYARLPTDFKRLLFKITAGRFKFIDHRMRDMRISQTRKQAWFMDQYRHPHESSHTFGEVLGWFRKNAVEFLNSVPKARAGDSFTSQESLFDSNPEGSWFDHLAVQSGMLLSGGAEGGFFLMIGGVRSR